MKKILFTFLILSFVLTGCFLKKSPVVNDAEKKGENKQVEEKIDKEEERIVDWKIFENNRYNFSIKYPSTAYTWIESDGSSFIPLEQIDEVIISDSKDKELFVHIEVKDFSYNKYDEYTISKKEIIEASLKDYANKIWELNSKWQSVKESGLSKISFKGRDAYTFSSSEGYQDEMGGSVHSSKINYIFTEDKGLKYVFGFSDTKISKEVLETFQFSADETADWQTYRNEEYGFEVKYPESLTLDKQIEFRDKSELKCKEEGNCNEPTPTLSINIEKNINDAKKYIFENNPYLKSEDVKEIKINNNFLNAKIGEMHRTDSYFIIKNSNLIEIDFYKKPTNLRNDQIEKILNSFKFIN